MRLYEFTLPVEEAINYGSHPVDPESGLIMNTINTWARSPYLGAISNPQGSGYLLQIHITQGIWENVINNQINKWKNSSMPQSMFNPAGSHRSPIRFGPFKDPRQAAWVYQTILYDSSYNAYDIIDDYFTGAYIEGLSSADAFKRAAGDILRRIPEFTGDPLEEKDREEWFKKNAVDMGDKNVHIAARNPRDEELAKEVTQKKNIEAFNKKAPGLITKEILDVADTKALRRKIFGKRNITTNQIKQAVNNAIEDLGLEYFMQGIKVKDPLTFDLSKYVD